MKTLSETGVWWTPDDPGKREAGTLLFDSSDGGVLALVSSRPLLADRDADNDCPLLYGETTGGTPITLLDCFKQQAQRSSTGVQRTEVYANYVIKGLHLPSREGRHVREARVSFRLLGRWMQHPGITVQDVPAALGLEIKYVRPRTTVIDTVPHFRFSLESMLESYPMGPSWDGDIAIREDWFVRVTPDEPLTFDAMLATIRTLQDFLSFACLHLCDPMQVLIVSAGGELVTEHSPLAEGYYRVGWRERGARASHPADFLFRFPQVAPEIEKIIERWFSRAETLRPVRNLYFDALYGPESYAESEFMAAVQAAEVFHRRLRPGWYLPPDEFESVIQAPLAAAIPPSVDPSFRESLRQRIRYLNEFGLRRRLKDLYAENREVVDSLVPDAESYLADAVTFRNFLTHFTGDVAPASVHSERIVMCSEVLKLLVEMSLLRELGLSDALIRELARGCGSYRFRYARWPHPKPAG